MSRADDVAAAALAVAGGAVPAGSRADDVRRLTGGASRETWSLDLVLPDGAVVPVVARVARADALNAALDVEADALRSAAAAGAPVPEVLGVAPVAAVDGSVMVMRREVGETIARRILRDEAYADVRPLLARRLGEVAASVHAAAVPASVPDVVGDPVDLLVAELGGGHVPPPGLAVGLRWLREHPPPASPARCLVHGDLRMGNVMVSAEAPGGVGALLDWELVHVGDPVEDLGWLCAKVWRFGGPGPVGGVGSREELLDGYAAVAGWRPSGEALAWWELFATVRWGLMTRVMADRVLDAHEESVELVTIGRRAAEQEHDVLLHLGVELPDASLAPAPRPSGAGVHGVPTAADLLDGVRHWLVSGPLAGSGAAGFEARVALTALDVVRRELARGATDDAAHAALLDDLGLADDLALSRAVLDGSSDDRWDAVLAAVADGVARRLAVANPRH
ncbi:MAG: hypothetical protein CMH83_14490 [Nocardioides sp.]|nr:hypothetical protein [Nocardioides sp.]